MPEIHEPTFAPGGFGLNEPSEATMPGTGEAGMDRDWDWVFGSPVVNVRAGGNSLSAQATEYVHVQATATDVTTDAPQDPTGDSVWLAFTDGIAPEDADWLAGEWLTRTADVALGNSYWARTLVGPNAPTQLPVGELAVYIKIGDSVETPVAYAGALTVQ